MLTEVQDNVRLFSLEFLKQRDYWKNKLSGDIGKTEFFGDLKKNRETPGSKERKEKIDIAFNDELSSRVLALSKRSDLAIYILLLAGLKSLISRYTGDSDITVMSPVNQAAVSENTLNNIVLIRDQVDNETSFKELILQVRQSTLEAYNHQDYPLTKLLEYLFKSTQMENTRFISNIACLLENIHGDVDMKEIGGMLSFFFSREEDRLRGWIRYDPAVYPRFYIEQIARHFIHLLGSLLKDVNEKIIGGPFLSVREKQRLLSEFNDNKKVFPGTKTVGYLVAERAEKVPDRVAIVYEDEELTYLALEEGARYLEYILLGYDIKRDQPVGIMLERDPRLVEAVLAVWKVGGAYIPVDHRLPVQRIARILTDSAPAVLVARPENVESRLLDFFKGPIIPPCDPLYETGSKNPPKGNKIGPGSGPDMNSLAYIIYTSGSTGSPRGAAVEHKGMLNHIQAKIHDLRLTGESIVAQNASHLFDISVWQFFTALTLGGKTIIYPDEATLNPEVFITRVKTGCLTVLEVVPSYLTVMLEFLEFHHREMTTLEYLLVTGEELGANLVKRWLERYPTVPVVNAYGPTEASDDITHYFLDKPPDVGVIPIGKPLWNLSIYIMDHHMELCPVGVKGEICVAGVGVGRGYLNNPEITAEKFIPDPYAFAPGFQSPVTQPRPPLFKTGDVGLWQMDGTILFCGRKDYQVKIRGFRIELGEIERHIKNYPGVKEAVVTMHSDPADSRCLCAYITAANHDNPASGGNWPDTPTLKEYLSRELPDYMIPTYFVPLEKIPLTANGKIDRNALPEPTDHQPGIAYTPPRNQLEEKLVSVCQEVLGVEKIGIDDNFFEHGGDSIKAVQVSARLMKYGLRLDVRDLFLNPTVRQLEKFARKTDRGIRQGPTAGEVELTPVLQWFLRDHLTGKHHFNQSVMLFKEDGFDHKILRSLLGKLAEHHDALRIVCKEENHQVVLLNRGLTENAFDLEIFDMRRSENQNLEVEIEKEAALLQAGFDLRKGPLVKAGLFHTTEGDHLLIVIHHLVIDGLSWRILLEDFAVGYRQAERGEEIKFQEKTNSFRYWAGKLKEYAAGKKALKELAYWKEVEALRVERLPRDHELSPGEKKIGDTASITLGLDAGKTRELLTKVNQPYNTGINDILLTALGMAISEWGGVKKVLINLEGHGREEIIEGVNITRTVGWFTSLYPLVLDMSRWEDLSYTIKSVKETLRKIPNKGIGYGILRYLTPAETRGNIDFELEPEISFNYLGQFGQEKNFPGLFKMSRMKRGEEVDPQREQEYTINIDGILVGGELNLSFDYNKKEYEKGNIQRLVNGFKSNLIDIIRHCCQKPDRELTPTDVDNPNLAIETLDKITAHLGRDREIQRVYSLSHLQKGIVLHAVMAENSPFYFVQVAYSMEGKIDGDLLVKSLNILIDRHDILRTIFVLDLPGLDEPMQVVLKKCQAAVYTEDISHLPGEEQYKYFEKFKKSNREKGFNLSKDILVKMSLLNRGNHLYWVLWEFHHAIIDGWCLQILYKELIEIYLSLKEGKDPVLEPVTQYHEFIDWLEKQDEEAGLRYWQQYLKDYCQRASLQKFTHRPQGNEYKREEYCFTIEETLNRGIEKIARENRVTDNTVVETVWGILLQKYNRTGDVVFGVVVSGRPPGIKGIEQMAGLFINTIPVRIRNEESEDFSQLIKKVQQQEAASKSYEYLSLADIQSNSLFKRELIDHIMAFENYPFQETVKNLPSIEKKLGFTVKFIDVFEQSNYDLNIVFGLDKAMQVKIHYNASVYDSNLIKKVASHFMEIIKQVVQNHHIKLKDIKISHDLAASTSYLRKNDKGDFDF